jgi:hypothetical protein
MKTRSVLWFGLLFCGLLVGCSSGVAAPTPTSFPTPTMTVVPQNTVQVTATFPNLALANSIQQTLAQQLHISPSQILIVSVQSVTWPDTCLGITQPDIACAQIVTAGFRIILQAPTGRYEYHTDSGGDNIVLASSPTSDSSTPSLVYRQKTASFCQQTSIDFGMVEIAICDGPQTDIPFANFDRQAELEELTNTFTSYRYENPAETIAFTGAGTVQPSPAEQRSILEWARVVSNEAYGKISNTANNPVITLHRAGGLAGFCDDINIFSDGFMTVSSCKGGHAMNLGKFRLTSAQLEQLFLWLDSFKSAEINQNNINPDALNIHLIFSGQGSQTPTSADLQALQDYAADVFTTSQTTKKP